jgi:Holliday junction DNA helicase RuvB
MTERNEALRPESLADFTGQSDVVRHLGIVLKAAAQRNELPDHMLFSGPPGLGKTTLAGIVSAECGANFIVTSGPAIERPGDLAALLSGITVPSVVFIDEIHRMPRQVEEVLYPAMEDGVLDFVVGEGQKARTVRLPLAPLCVIGATTQSGMLSAPLRDRFGFQARLRLYDEQDLAKIVQRSANLLGCHITPDAAVTVALRSRGTPRIANTLLRRVRDFAQLQDTDINVDIANDALKAFGIDDAGLDRLGLDILRALCETFRGGPAGLTAIAAAVGEAPTTVSEVYEPYLMNQGFLQRTPRGRVATVDAYEHLGLPVPGHLLGIEQSEEDSPPLPY